ncbi:MAG: hypothetical protein ACKO96_22450, partial [Flammeovirgaceae bacterium]
RSFPAKLVHLVNTPQKFIGLQSPFSIQKILGGSKQLTWLRAYTSGQLQHLMRSFYELTKDLI